MSKKIIKVIMSIFFGTLGITMIFSKIFHSQQKKESDQLDIEDEGHVKFNILLGGGAKYITTQKFEQADLKCRFGGMEVYFDNASLFEGKGIIKIDSSFSGVELYMPKDWTVVNDLRVGMGAVEFKNGAQPDPDKIVTLVGNVSLGAVEIHYV